MSKSKSRISDDFIDGLDNGPIGLLTNSTKAKEVDGKDVANSKKHSTPVKEKAALQADNVIDNERERMTVQMSRSIIERVKDCVYWNRSTIAQFVEEALEAALKRAEKENGKPFEKRRSELKPGRPTK